MTISKITNDWLVKWIYRVIWKFLTHLLADILKFNILFFNWSSKNFNKKRLCMLRIDQVVVLGTLNLLQDLIYDCKKTE